MYSPTSTCSVFLLFIKQNVSLHPCVCMILLSKLGHYLIQLYTAIRDHKHKHRCFNIHAEICEVDDKPTLHGLEMFQNVHECNLSEHM